MATTAISAYLRAMAVDTNYTVYTVPSGKRAVVNLYGVVFASGSSPATSNFLVWVGTNLDVIDNYTEVSLSTPYRETGVVLLAGEQIGVRRTGGTATGGLFQVRGFLEDAP